MLLFLEWLEKIYQLRGPYRDDRYRRIPQWLRGIGQLSRRNGLSYVVYTGAPSLPSPRRVDFSCNLAVVTVRRCACEILATFVGLNGGVVELSLPSPRREIVSILWMWILEDVNPVQLKSEDAIALFTNVHIIYINSGRSLGTRNSLLSLADTYHHRRG